MTPPRRQILASIPPLCHRILAGGVWSDFGERSQLPHEKLEPAMMTRCAQNWICAHQMSTSAIFCFQSLLVCRPGKITPSYSVELNLDNALSLTKSLVAPYTNDMKQCSLFEGSGSKTAGANWHRHNPIQVRLCFCLAAGRFKITA